MAIANPALPLLKPLGSKPSSRKPAEQQTNGEKKATEETVFYPESDGKPMASGTVQYKEITTIVGNLEIIHEKVPDVFIAGDLFWYPVRGNNRIFQAPDVMVAIGRPKGDRGSYKQWEEGNIPPQVAFEIISPSNTQAEMDEKFNFYERYGVEEYYVYDPQRGTLEGWLRSESEEFVAIRQMRGWRSPLLGIRFEQDRRGKLQLYTPSGERFLTFIELEQQRKEAVARAQSELRARLKAEACVRAEVEARTAAETQTQQAEAQAEHETQARLKAEAQAEHESQARLKAEAQAEREAQARAELEARVRELEEIIKQKSG